MAPSLFAGYNLKKYSHGIPVDHSLKSGPLWGYKHTEVELEELEKTDGYNYWSQYMQAPHKKGGTIFETDWWRHYKILPPFSWKAIFCDTALKDKEHNDFTVFQCWAKWEGRIYLIDQYRDRVLAVDLKQKLIEFWNKHKGTVPQSNRGCYIEDKSSGTQLIQEIQRKGGIPIIAIPRDKSKVERANNLVNWIKSGLLYLPEDAEFLYDYKIEFERFSPLMTHKHDDQIDATLDAIEQMLILSPDLKPPTDNDKKNKPLAPGRTEKVW